MEEAKELEGWMSVADIVREVEGEREMTLQRECGREGKRTIQARGNQTFRKHVCTDKWKKLQTYQWQISIVSTQA